MEPESGAEPPMVAKEMPQDPKESAESILNAPGVLRIKKEFLDWNKLLKTHHSQPSTEGVSQGSTGSDDTSPQGETEPPNKKGKWKKAKGQNKRRPHQKPSELCDVVRLCPSFLKDPDSCQFGEKCRFTHSVEEYLANKPADLGDKCYVYDTHGRCPFGITCRFAKCHTDDQNQNVVNPDVYSPEAKPTTSNQLPKDTQTSLRKKQYKFPKSNEYLRAIGKLSTAQGSGDDNSFLDKKSSEAEEVKPEITIHSTASEASGNAQDKVSNCRNGNDLSTPDIQGCTEATVENPTPMETNKPSGSVTNEDSIRLIPRERKKLDFADKLYLAPLTTVGNLPFRRICKGLGADITCGEMAMAANLLQGQSSEWALLKRHQSEDVFGVQICGSHPEVMSHAAELLNETISVDFVDVNVGCPIDLVFKRGGGCALMGRLTKFEQVVKGMIGMLDVPLTVKMRTGIYEEKPFAYRVVPHLRDWGVSLVTLHGRSREQRYTKLADWDYIAECAKAASPMPLFGNGDILSFEDANRHRQSTGVAGLMIARGALIKPWIFTEIKEQHHWDISSHERFQILKDFSNFGLEHWGSDTQGVEKTRRFMLEWLSFLFRYVPVGVLEQPPQKINLRPPYFLGRDDLETLMASGNCADWVRISEMLLGPAPANFNFLPKHKANSYR
ncbi:PREDICTED: tRNA-dihydrouridine(47) synthase [NAD(P)(+)]-like isoform X1 [Branchiostoma belcheri]|uniref:tRNA-dihydrouridine(47) synthase [NAD(P)(+)] n=1 Tax=Branchiostoma belcheri TaxID=7741 RepID=A0A6P4XYH0_BRABE|nr:PREDICTED: tRNA-dihydrouridine(47) synthase [NAD(P)(+)]-like isoform X1 [Branchiostoma belcheri]